MPKPVLPVQFVPRMPFLSPVQSGVPRKSLRTGFCVPRRPSPYSLLYQVSPRIACRMAIRYVLCRPRYTDTRPAGIKYKYPTLWYSLYGAFRFFAFDSAGGFLYG
eukprot:3869005-Rhodomonas_salina.1